jgi:hypothetical protein
MRSFERGVEGSPACSCWSVLRAGLVELDDAEVDVSDRGYAIAGRHILGADLPVAIKDLMAVTQQVVRVAEEDWVARDPLGVVLGVL